MSFPSPTKAYRNAPYAAIDPKRPELSVKGKTVIITGAGAGIGQHIALEFAIAGPKDIHIIGRTQSTLDETKALLAKEAGNVPVTTYIADVTDEIAIQKAAQSIGKWDVLIHNAGYLTSAEEVTKSDTKEWWQSFETNVLGSFIVSKHFVPNHKPDAALIAMSTLGIALPPAMTAGLHAYGVSKLAVVKFFEFLASEHPELQVITIHPGVIDTAMATKSGMVGKLPFDDSKLPAHFVIWASSKEAAFANGKFLSVNWDVEELKTNPKFTEDPFYSTAGLVPWPNF